MLGYNLMAIRFKLGGLNGVAGGQFWTIDIYNH
jgi:hypothetical protein